MENLNELRQDTVKKLIEASNFIAEKISTVDDMHTNKLGEYAKALEALTTAYHTFCLDVDFEEIHN